ncbi:MAG: hypothetical protein ACLQHF_00965 [Terracidiphilus sp.]
MPTLYNLIQGRNFDRLAVLSALGPQWITYERALRLARQNELTPR